MDEPDSVAHPSPIRRTGSEPPMHVLQLDVGGRDSEFVTLRIFVPELNISKVFQCHSDEVIWNIKQQCLASLPKELKEGFNYGLFFPPSNGRAGKFLEEERPLLDYAFHGPEAYLELKYKRRVYKMLNLDEKALRALHTRVNLRRFLDYVSSGNVEKVTKMCSKGLDPNFHCHETGETPLTIAASNAKTSQQLIMALVGGGALLDYRTKCGSTSLHRAAEKGRVEAVRTLLDLGASPNMRDGKGFTALYLAVSSCAPAAVCLSLLYDHSMLGITDSQGWQEVHQACRNGLVQHLEHLLFYGADMNARNASGNTPLHVCAVNNQEACTRLLLFRGCFKDALNYANQTPFQVAVIAGNQNLAELISGFKVDDVVPFKEPPTYNNRRRKSGMSRYSSDFRLSAPNTPSSSYSPPTPTQANMAHLITGSAVRVLPPLSSSGYGSIGGSSGVPPSPCPSDRVWTDNAALSTSSASSCTADSEDGGSANGSSIADKSIADQSDRVSDSSGVGTSHSGSAGSNDATPTDASLTLCLYPEGMTVVCTEAYDTAEEGHLCLQPGDIIEVTGSTDQGYLEGRLRGMFGVFPPSHVQEVRLRNPYAIAAAQHHPLMSGSYSPLRMRTPSPSITNNERRDLLINQFGTLQRVRRMFSDPRTVILHKGQRGFGFVLRGAKSSTPLRGASPLLDGRFPALQYLESVDPGSVADKAGLKTGDFLLAINGEDVSRASHEAVVSAIQSSGDLVTMTVCSPLPQPETINCSSLPPTPADQGPMRQCVTLPRKFQGRPPQPPRRDPKTTLSVGRAKAKSLIGGLAAMNAAEKSKGEVIYASTDSKTASIRPRPTSSRMSTSEELFRLGPAPVPPVQAPKTPKVYASVSAMKRLKKQKPPINNDTQLHRIFYSTPDLAWETDIGGSQSTLTPAMSNGNSPDTPLATPCGPASLPHDWRKSQSHENVNTTSIYGVNVKNTRHSWAFNLQQRYKVDKHYDEAWKDLEHSQTDGTSESDDDALTPVNDLSDHSPSSIRSASETRCEDNLLGVSEYRTVKPCRPVGGTLPRRVQSPIGPPPPTDPPPPVPPSQVVMVDVSKGCSEYASLTVLSPKLDKTGFSSFRPDENKVYASPEKLGTIRRALGTTRSRSLPLRSPKPNVPIRNSDVMSASYTEEVQTPCQNTVYDEPVKPETEAPFIPEPDYDSDTESGSTQTREDPSALKPQVTSPPRVVEEPLKPVSEGRKFFDQKAKGEYREKNESIYVSFVPVKPEEKIVQPSNHRDSFTEEIESDSSENTLMCRLSSKQEDSSSSVSTLSSGSLPSDHLGTIEIPVKFDSDEVSPLKSLTEKEIDSEIEKSLEMIRLHVSSMQEVQPQAKPSFKAGNPPLPPLPDYDEDQSPNDDFLPPPPPEFCDITSGKGSIAPPLPPPPTLKQLNDDFLRGRPKPKMERRLSEELFRPSPKISDDLRPNARVVGIVPKKVSFSPEVTLCDPKPEKFYGTLPTNFNRGYRMKSIDLWSVQDVCDWLDSLSLSEYKASFSRNNIGGDKLILLSADDLNNIGVRNLSHRLHIEKSLLRYRKN